MKFLGDVPLTETAGICGELQRAAIEVKPFELTLAGAGAFPNASRPSTIWLGTAGDDRPMRDLHASVERRLQKLGFRRDGRRFQAHLTLGRVHRGGTTGHAMAELLKQSADYEAGKTRVDQIVLFSSQLTPAGPIYQSIGRARLGGG